MKVFRSLGEDQLQNIIDFYLDYRDFMTAQEMLVVETVIKRKKVTVEEAYILTRLEKELKNLE